MNNTTEYSGFSDAELVAQLINGDENAFIEIHNRYKRGLFMHAYKKLGDFEEAKELIQDMFSTLWHERKSIPDTENMVEYLYTMTKNKVLIAMSQKDCIADYVASFNTFIEGKHLSQNNPQHH